MYPYSGGYRGVAMVSTDKLRARRKPIITGRAGNTNLRIALYQHNIRYILLV